MDEERKPRLGENLQLFGFPWLRPHPVPQGISKYSESKVASTKVVSLLLYYSCLFSAGQQETTQMIV